MVGVKAYLTGLCIAYASLLAQSFRCDIRYRQSWSSLSIEDKDLFREAVAMSMDRGYFSMFTDAHVSPLSLRAAHGVCTFGMWHRVLLLGFENMLRSLDERFACVVVPYWDHVSNYERQMNGDCSGIDDCDATRFELGGQSTTRQSIRTTIQGSQVIDDVCASGFPYHQSCGSSRKQRCRTCVPRIIRNRAISSTASFSSIYAQVMGQSDIDDMLESIETGLHNDIHAILGSTMRTSESPADITFYLHHAHIDLLIDIGVQCRLRQRIDPYNFCKINNAISTTERVYANGVVQIISGEFSSPAMSVYDSNHPLNQFFADMPRQYDAFVNLQNLGSYSTYYETSGFTQRLSITCEQALSPPQNLARNLEPEKTSRMNQEIQAPSFSISRNEITGSQLGEVPGTQQKDLMQGRGTQEPHIIDRMYQGAQQMYSTRMSALQLGQGFSAQDEIMKRGSEIPQQIYIPAQREPLGHGPANQRETLNGRTGSQLGQGFSAQDENLRRGSGIPQQMYIPAQQEPLGHGTANQREYPGKHRGYQDSGALQKDQREGVGTQHPFETQQFNRASQQEYAMRENRQPKASWKEVPLPPNEQNHVFTSNSLQWIYEAEHLLQVSNPSGKFQSTSQPSTATLLQLEMMVCMFHDRCRGGVTEYSEAFLDSFKPSRKQSRCYMLVHRVTADRTQLRLENWMGIMSKYFRCEKVV